MVPSTCWFQMYKAKNILQGICDLETELGEGTMCPDRCLEGEVKGRGEKAYISPAQNANRFGMVCSKMNHRFYYISAILAMPVKGWKPSLSVFDIPIVNKSMWDAWIYSVISPPPQGLSSKLVYRWQISTDLQNNITGDIPPVIASYIFRTIVPRQTNL